MESVATDLRFYQRSTPSIQPSVEIKKGVDLLALGQDLNRFYRAHSRLAVDDYRRSILWDVREFSLFKARERKKVSSLQASRQPFVLLSDIKQKDWLFFNEHGLKLICINRFSTQRADIQRKRVDLNLLRGTRTGRTIRVLRNLDRVNVPVSLEIKKREAPNFWAKWMLSLPLRDEIFKSKSCLQSSNHTHNCSQYAGLGAVSHLSFRRLRIKAPIAGPLFSKEQSHLPFKLVYSPIDHGDSRFIGRIVNQKFGLKIIRAINHQIIPAKNLLGILSTQRLLMRFNYDFRVKFKKPLFSNINFKASLVRSLKEDLPLKIRKIYRVWINQPKATHASCGKVQTHGRAKTTHTHAKHTSAFEPFLAFSADFRKNDLSAKTIQIHRHWFRPIWDKTQFFDNLKQSFVKVQRLCFELKVMEM